MNKHGLSQYTNKLQAHEVIQSTRKTTLTSSIRLLRVISLYTYDKIFFFKGSIQIITYNFIVMIFISNQFEIILLFKLSFGKEIIDSSGYRYNCPTENHFSIKYFMLLILWIFWFKALHTIVWNLVWLIRIYIWINFLGDLTKELEWL